MEIGGGEKGASYRRCEGGLFLSEAEYPTQSRIPAPGKGSKLLLKGKSCGREIDKR